MWFYYKWNTRKRWANQQNTLCPSDPNYRMHLICPYIHLVTLLSPSHGHPSLSLSSFPTTALASLSFPPLGTRCGSSFVSGSGGGEGGADAALSLVRQMSQLRQRLRCSSSSDDESMAAQATSQEAERGVSAVCDARVPGKPDPWPMAAREAVASWVLDPRGGGGV